MDSNWKETVSTEMLKMLTNRNANRYERIEAAKLLCALNGVLLPDVDERYLTATASIKLRRAKASLVEPMLVDGKLPKIKANQDGTDNDSPGPAPTAKTAPPTPNAAKPLSYFERQDLESKTAAQAEPDLYQQAGEKAQRELAARAAEAC
jgi:hypothetical protein